MKRSAPLAEQGQVISLWGTIVSCMLITFVGINLRTVILGVPPVLPLIKQDLLLSYSATGLLTALPVLIFGLAALPSGMLVDRIGGRWCVIIGLFLLTAGALLRVLWLNAVSLFLFTIILSIGIAMAQTAIPVLIRRWFPERIGLVAALFTDGLIVGEVIAAGSTVPLMQHWFGRDAWNATFVFWSIPVILALALWLWLAPPVAAPLPRMQPSTTNSSGSAGVRKRASSRQPFRVNPLHLGIMISSGSLIYFGMNGWIATYNQVIHHADLTPLTLSLLNFAQLPSSLGVTFFAQRLVGRRSPFIVTGIISLIAIILWVLTPATWEPLWAIFLGSSSALVFTLGIALPPLLAEPEGVARLTGITLSLNYGVAFVGPFLGGELWDLFHLPVMAFLPIALAGIVLIILGSLLPPRSTFMGSRYVSHTDTPGSGTSPQPGSVRR